MPLFIFGPINVFHPPRNDAMKNDSSEDGSVKVRITGCEYKVSGEKLKEALSHWGTVTTGSARL